MRGWVYFIGVSEDGSDTCWVKIGFTAGNVYARCSALQTGNPYALDVLAYAPGSLADEQRLHGRFSGFRGRGEWFEMDGFLQAYIHSLMAETQRTEAAPTLWTDAWHREHVA